MCDPAKGTCGSNNQASAVLGMEPAIKMATLEQMEVDESSNDSLPVPPNGGVVRSRSFYNVFMAKKTVAQGMMDIALITANANQLRYLIEYCRASDSFYIIFALIIISLFLQVIVGILLIFKGRQHLRREKSEHAVRVNNCIVFGVFLITVINVFISAFSVNAFVTVPPTIRDEKTRSR